MTCSTHPQPLELPTGADVHHPTSVPTSSAAVAFDPVPAEVTLQAQAEHAVAAPGLVPVTPGLAFVHVHTFNSGVSCRRLEDTEQSLLFESQDCTRAARQGKGGHEARLSWAPSARRATPCQRTGGERVRSEPTR